MIVWALFDSGIGKISRSLTMNARTYHKHLWKIFLQRYIKDGKEE